MEQLTCLTTEQRKSRPGRNPATPPPPEGADEQDQEDPTTKREKTFLEHAKDAMDEHETLGKLLGQ